MSNTALTITGLMEAKGMLKALPEIARAQGEIVLDVTCAKIASDIKKKISTYGEPDGVPRRRTGALLMGVRVGRKTKTLTSISRTVGVNPDTEEVGYAVYLEYGTSRMKPRPYVAPTVEENRKGFMTNLSAALSRKLKI
jgi:HK97 gp10 family phage protein